MKFCWKTLYAIVLGLSCSIDQNSSTCTRSPVIIGYSRPHGELVSIYKFIWKISTCHSDIYQYEIQFVESCSITQPVTVSTGNNRTTALIVIPSCAASGCYVRVRAEMTDQSFTEYSSCVLLTSTFSARELYVEHLYDEVCVPVQGTCNHGFTSEFSINGHLVVWPEPNASDFRTIYSPTTEEYRFCLINVTSNITFFEYCNQDHTAGCSLCSVDSGEVHFLSYSNIILQLSISESGDSNNNSVINNHSGTKKILHANKTYVPTSRYVLDKNYNTSSISEEKISFLSVAGAISIGTTSGLIGMSLLAFLVILWSRKQSKNPNTPCLAIKGKSKPDSDNIYDEPSVPDPIYQELDISTTTSETRMNMTRNDSYSNTVLKINDSYTPSFMIKNT